MKHFFLLSCLALAACSTGISTQKYNNAPATPDSFVLCHGYSCTSKTPTGFTNAEWMAVESVFEPAPKTAEDERSKIGRALALMERQIGAKTGTDEDIGAAVTRKTSRLQLDCIDETVNTTHYVGFLQKAGWLKFHEITEPTHRGYFIDGRWPHNTAVIREKETGTLWAVDTFYRPNGEEPYILPRADWLAGWKPPGATQ
jgi:hypothetical protein